MYNNADVYGELSERDRRSLYDDEEAGYWFDILITAAGSERRAKTSMGYLLLSMKESGTKFERGKR